MANFRELTTKEKKLYKIFEKGYVEGLKEVSPMIKSRYLMNHNKPAVDLSPSELDITQSYKENVMIFKRNKTNEKEYRNGFLAGYFRCLSSEHSRTYLDPEINEEVREYLQNTWLSRHIYPTEE